MNSEHGALRCATHPNVETYLTCARCGTPICPDCLVETPVGMKCRDCGRAPVPPVYQVTPGRLALSIIAGVALGGAVGALALIGVPPGFGLLAIFLAPLAGGLIGETASRASGGKRGPVVALATAVSCAIGMALLGPQLLFGGAVSLLDIGAVLLRRPFILLFMALTVLTAFWRIR